ncbi:hypothetical protein CK203_031736 [Vitis vinifera]|uniref:Uncharacterized protein n=1 Tax=Vitis vinifera TaxID=29760 RepID=A0A438I378_VITVI|nr:hypothetical protein CK203_073837 [Vitis vinifera]RVW91168.1 hypothetical protein CK203_031736 [Vitis vinifera]
MVAISLYRGNLHRVPDVTRRWLMPTNGISLKDFRSLLSRRSAALSRLRSAAGTSSNPNPILHKVKLEKEEEPTNAIGCPARPQEEQPPKVINPEEEEEEEKPALNGKGKEGKGSDGDDCVAKSVGVSGSSPGSNPIVPGNASDPADGHGNSQGEKAVAVSQNPNLEIHILLPPHDVFQDFSTNDLGRNGIVLIQRPSCLVRTKANKNVDAVNDQEKRKREIEEKLQILNAKKHNLVQVLKQILNAEEELKRRNNMQGMTIRPSGPLHIDTTNDSGSLTRQVTPRLGSDANLGGEMEGGEPDDISNHNMHSRHLLRMSSTSPSSDSPLRRPYIQHNAFDSLSSVESEALETSFLEEEVLAALSSLSGDKALGPDGFTIAF